MKFNTILLTAFFVAPIVSSPVEQADQHKKNFVPVPLERPHDWIAGDRLFPSNVIAGYNADLDDYDAESWSKHILKKCKSFDACTSSISYSAINSGTPKERAWFGFVFRGGPTEPCDYERSPGVKHSIAYTIC